MIETSREKNMVVIARDDNGTPTVWCDPEIADIVAALNAAGIATVASCSGHGHRPGRISLADGRDIILPRDIADMRLIEAAFPKDINGEPVPPVDETERLRAALRPFAHAAKWWKAFHDYHRITTLHQHGDCLEVGHLRAAESALRPQEGEVSRG